MFCMFVIIAILSAECKCFFPISKKNHDFFESEKICGKNWPFCYFLCAFYVIFSHIFRKNSFSQKNIPC